MGMKIIESFVTSNPQYTRPTRIFVRKLVLHSVGCPQPDAAVFVRQWQTAQYFAHAVLQEDGTVYQVMPWDYRVFHVGSANAYSVGVEMTEPDCIKYTGGATFTCSNLARAREQATGTYRTAVELFAYLGGELGLDPYGAIISHAEAGRMGIGTTHADPEHLWRQLGLEYTMDGFRRDVYAAMQNKTDEEDEDNVTRYNTVAEMPEYYRAEAQALIDAGALKGGTDGSLNISEDMLRCMIISKRYMDALLKGAGTDPSGWAADELAEAVAAGITDGTRPRGYATREEAAIMVKRASYGNIEELGG